MAKSKYCTSFTMSRFMRKGWGSYGAVHCLSLVLNVVVEVDPWGCSSFFFPMYIILHLSPWTLSSYCTTCSGRFFRSLCYSVFTWLICQVLSFSLRLIFQLANRVSSSPTTEFCYSPTFRCLKLAIYSCLVLLNSFQPMMLHLTPRLPGFLNYVQSFLKVQIDYTTFPLYIVLLPCCQISQIVFWLSYPEVRLVCSYRFILI